MVFTVLTSSVLFVCYVMIINMITLNNPTNVLALVHHDLSRARMIDLGGAIGPESLAFDPRGRGPYTGVADGRILKWHGGPSSRGWHQFAVTSSQRHGCSNMSYNPSELEHKCGRPLGLKFHNKTGNLYVADAYLGLQVIGPHGGLGRKIVTKVEGKRLLLPNDLDIDEERDVIYFTDSSRVYQRKDFIRAFFSKDKTGRLMKYDIARKKVTVLLRGIAFANGMCLSEDRSFVLVAESGRYRIIRFWVKGPKRGRHEIFARVPGTPDNIRRSSNGNFWAALSFNTLRRRRHDRHKKRGNATAFGLSTQGTVVKLSGEGKILQVLHDVEGNNFNLVSEVDERNDKLWIGSLEMPYVGIYRLK